MPHRPLNVSQGKKVESNGHGECPPVELYCVVRKLGKLLATGKGRKGVREKQKERKKQRTEKGDSRRREDSVHANLLEATRPSSRRKMASCFEVILVCCILVLPFLYETSRTFRYYFKFFIYYFTVLFNATWLLPIISMRPRNVKNFV